MSRSSFLQRLAFTYSLIGLVGTSRSYAFTPNNNGVHRPSEMAMETATSTIAASSISSVTAGYRSLSLDLPSFDVTVPVAMWFPPANSIDDGSEPKSLSDAVYSHRISVKKIGSLLANLNFIPEFAAKDFSLSSTSDGVLVGNDLAPESKTAPVVILAHGFLGSRFDLSHLGEALAKEGFICLSPEYPESLASSYDKKEGLDRSVITNQLLQYAKNDLDLKPKAFGIVGHSLGCGTAMTTGDETWTRVCIAGSPVRRDGVDTKGRGTLAITSLNDGLVTLSRLESMIPRDFARLDERSIRETPQALLPKKSILIMDRDDAPNHISFLAGNVNDCMVGFLSPLLPVAQALQIPVLDFDKYKESRDSVATSEVVIPLVSSFLRQSMM